MTMSISNWSLAHISKVCNNVQYGAPYSSASKALKRLGWKPLLMRTMEHQAIFMYKLLYNHFCCSIPVSFNCDFHDYYTRSRNDIRKSSATRRWGHWSSVNLNSNIWNRVDASLREAETLSSFNCGLSKAIL